MEWISVKDGLPEGECLCISTKNGASHNEYLVGWITKLYEGYVCESDDVIMYDVTHWILLPEPPKENE